jgi:DNA topoisomerase-1
MLNICQLLQKINIGEYTFSAKGREVIFDGFTKISQPMKSDDDDILPPLSEGDNLDLNEIKIRAKIHKATCKIF